MTNSASGKTVFIEPCRSGGRPTIRIRETSKGGRTAGDYPHPYGIFQFVAPIHSRCFCCHMKFLAEIDFIRAKALFSEQNHRD